MMRSFVAVVAAAALLVATACRESTSPSSSSSDLAAAFLTTPGGFASTDNTFQASSEMSEAWMPDRGARDDGGMMGGGLRPEFLGGIGLGRGWNRGPFAFSELLSNCTLSATTGRVSCPDVTRGALTISRSFSFIASGAAQAAPNASTNTINARITVSGTLTRHDGNVTSTVHDTSDRTVSGLAPGSAQRTVNGTSIGREESAGKPDDGTSFTASRLVTDTTNGLIVPLQDGRPTFPIAGRIVRLIQVTLTATGKSPVSASRKEVVTYDASGTATVVITKTGVTKSCKLTARGGLKC